MCSENFTALDKDKSGKLDGDETAGFIIEMLQGMPQAGPPPSAEQCLQFIKAFDANGDGVLSQPEFFFLVEYVVVLTYIASQTASAALAKAEAEAEVAEAEWAKKEEAAEEAGEVKEA